MKSLTLVCLLAVVAAAVARPETHYTSKYDNVNLDEIIGNPRLLKPYIHCVLDKGKCSPDGKELKAHIREALEENCAKCTETQRTGSRKVIAHMINHEHDYWDQLVAKYDPEHKFSKKYEEDLKTVKA